MADRTQAGATETEDGLDGLKHYSLDQIGEMGLDVLGRRLEHDPDGLASTGLLQLSVAWLKIKERESLAAEQKQEAAPDALDTLDSLPPERQVSWLDQELGRLAARANLIRSRRAQLVKPVIAEVKE